MPITRICNYCNKRAPRYQSCECTKKRNLSKEKNKQYAEEKKFFNSKEWKDLRKAVLKRDCEVCQRCMIKYNIITKTTLEAHHIKSRHNYPELRWDESNLVTLCKSCNTQLGTSDKLDFDFVSADEEYHL